MARGDIERIAPIDWDAWRRGWKDWGIDPGVIALVAKINEIEANWTVADQVSGAEGLDAADNCMALSRELDALVCRLSFRLDGSERR